MKLYTLEIYQPHGMSVHYLAQATGARVYLEKETHEHNKREIEKNEGLPRSFEFCV